jgi:hypothetical protein
MQLAQSRNIDPLAPVDHSLIEYDDFAKDFYTAHPSITAMTDQQVRGLVGTDVAARRKQTAVLCCTLHTCPSWLPMLPVCLMHFVTCS